MPISLISGGNLAFSAANGGNVTITLPTLLQNDVVYLVAGRVGGPTMSTTGYTQVGTVTSGTHVVRVFRKVMGATPDTTVVVAGSGNAADAMSVALYCLRGVDFNTPEDVTATTASGSSTNPDNPAITTVTAGAWVIAAASSQVNDNAITGPTGYSSATFISGNDTNPSSAGIAYILEPTPATENPPSFTGWSTGAWGAITVAVRPGVDSSTTVTGVSATGQVGTAVGRTDVSTSLTGVSATGQVGTAVGTGSAVVPVTGLFASGQVGTAVGKTDVSVTLTGRSATGQVGTATVNLIQNATVTLTGLSATGQVGSGTTIRFSYAVTGLQATGSVGSVTVTGTAVVPVTGRSATGSVGTAVAALSPNITTTGLSATGSVGSPTVTGTAVVPVTGLSATGSVGSVVVSLSSTALVTGLSATGSVGSVVVRVDQVILVSGLVAYGQTSQSLVWGNISPSQDPNWNGITPSSAPGWSEITPAQVAGWSDIAPVNDPSYTPINPSQSTTWTPIVP